MTRCWVNYLRLACLALTSGCLGVLNAQGEAEQRNRGNFRLQLQHREDAVREIGEHPEKDLFVTIGDTDTWGLGEGVIRLWSSSSKKCLWKRKTGVMAGLVDFVGFSDRDELVLVFPEDYRSGNPADLRDPPAEQQVHILSAETGETIRDYPIVMEGVPLLSKDRKSIACSENGRISESINLANGMRETADRELFEISRNGVSQRTATRLTLPASDDGEWTIVVKGRILEGYQDEKLQWRREIDLKNNPQTIELDDWNWEKESMLAEGIGGDDAGKWFVLRGGIGNIRGGDGAGQDWVKILDTATGATLWEYAYHTDGLVYFHVSKTPGEVWLRGQSQRDPGDFWRSAPFAKVRLDGSNRIQHFPDEFEALSVDRMEMLDERHLICYSPPPRRKWCWDLKTLEVLWVAEPGEPEALLGKASVRTVEGKEEVFWRNEEKDYFVGLSEWPDVESIVSFRVPVRLRDRLEGFNIDDQADENGSEGRIKLVTAISGKEILWLAYSPEGFFSASRNAGSLLGIVDGLESYEIEQFALRLNRPDILLERLGTSDSATIEDIRKAIDRRQRKANITSTGTPDEEEDLPHVRILNRRIEGMNAKIEFEIEPGESGVVSYQIFHQGVPVFPPSGNRAGSGVLRFEESIPLFPGENKVEVSCLSGLGVESARATEHLIPSATPADGVKPDLYFFGIGVSDYADERVSDLSYADDDARDLATVFRSLSPGYRNVHTKVLLDGEVTRSADEAIAEFFGKARPHDCVVLFVAGHGIYVDDSYYFLTPDTNIDDIPAAALAFEEIEGSFDRSLSRNRLLLLDTCESGERLSSDGSLVDSQSKGSRFTPRVLSREAHRIVSAGGIKPNASFLIGDRFLSNDLFRRKGVVVISSCGDSEVALEHSRFENGLFTEALISGFESARADANRDGTIRKAELIDFIRSEIPRLVAEVDPETTLSQTPRIDRDNLENPLDIPSWASLEEAYSSNSTSSVIPYNAPVPLSVEEAERSLAPNVRYEIAYRGSEGMSVRDKPGSSGKMIADVGPGIFQSTAPEVRLDDGSRWAKILILGWMPTRVGKSEFLRSRGEHQWEVVWNRPNDYWVAMRQMRHQDAMLISRVGFGTRVHSIEVVDEDASKGYIRAYFGGWVCVRSSSGTEYLRRVD